jgi:hypothetical protein
VIVAVTLALAETGSGAELIDHVVAVATTETATATDVVALLCRRP